MIETLEIKRLKKEFYEIKKLFKNKKQIIISIADCIRLKDTLDLLIDRKFIYKQFADNMCYITLNEIEIEVVGDWIKEQIRSTKKLEEES